MESVYQPGDTLQRNPDLLSSKIDNETIMMSMLDGNYYGLNEVAGRIWEILAKPYSYKELIEVLLSEFDVDEATCNRDVAGFLKKLEEKKLIIITRDV
jgi:hypothetical protein